jgi:hypothetical protein
VRCSKRASWSRSAYAPSALAPVDHPSLVAVELHAAERAALVEIADRIGLELGLLGDGVLAKIFAAAGRAVAEIVDAVVVPPGAPVLQSLRQTCRTGNLSMTRMCE